MNNTTYSIKKSEIERKWYIIDAADKPLGRVATEAAKLLRGKHKPTYTPNFRYWRPCYYIKCKQSCFNRKEIRPKSLQTSFWIYWWFKRN